MKRKASPLGEMKTLTYFRDFAKRNELSWDPIRENMEFEAVSFTVSEQKIFKHSSLAQSVEHLTVNQGVTGSSPVGGAIKPFKSYAPLAQLVEQLTLNQWVPGSNP